MERVKASSTSNLALEVQTFETEWTIITLGLASSSVFGSSAGNWPSSCRWARISSWARAARASPFLWSKPTKPTCLRVCSCICTIRAFWTNCARSLASCTLIISIWTRQWSGIQTFTGSVGGAVVTDWANGALVLASC